MLADSWMRIIPAREAGLAAHSESTARIMGCRDRINLQQSATDMIEKVKLQSIDAEKLLAEKQEILNQNVEFISQGFAKVKDNLDQKFEKLNSNIQGKVSSFQDILQVFLSKHLPMLIHQLPKNLK